MSIGGGPEILIRSIHGFTFKRQNRPKSTELNNKLKEERGEPSSSYSRLRPSILIKTFIYSGIIYLIPR